MDTRLSVDVLSPGALSAAERSTWQGIVGSAPTLRSPFFRLEFALAADGVVPGAAVAVIHRRGEIAGFLPFQKRSGAAQPLAAPLCDYSGLIAPEGADIDLRSVLRLIGANSYRFGGLVSAAPPAGARCVAASPMRADLGQGLDAWLAGQSSARKFFKDKARAWRTAERDIGPLEFSLSDDGRDLLDFVISRKREQYRRTARHDIFACGWTEDFVRRLHQERTPGFGAPVATLRADGRVIAAELGLQAGAVRHIWFPTYDGDFARWGPGTLLMIALVKAVAADPSLTELDFGKAGEDYKRFYAAPSGTVYEGRLEVEAWRRLPAMAADATFAAAPSLRQVAEVRERLRRRFDIITACETTPASWMGGALDAVLKASRRGPAVSTHG